MEWNGKDWNGMMEQQSSNNVIFSGFWWSSRPQWTSVCILLALKQ